MTARRARAGAAPWWLSGEEPCASCLGVYAYEVERRCAHCDRGLCPHCGVTVRLAGVVVCETCAHEESRAPDGDRTGDP